MTLMLFHQTCLQKVASTVLLLFTEVPFTMCSTASHFLLCYVPNLNPVYLVTFNKTVIKANTVEPRAADYELDATSAWAYAIDPSTAKYVYAPPAGGILPSPIFDEGLPPGSITVSACSIKWTLAGDTFVTVPPTKPKCIGGVETIVLNPYGVRFLVLCSAGHSADY